MPRLTDPPDGGKAVIRPPLRLVHPAPPPKPKRRRRRHEADVFTAEQQAKLRAALGVARRAHGGRTLLAAAMGCSVQALKYAENGRAWGFSAALAIRLARVAGVSLDDILRPGLRVVRTPEGGAA